MDVTRCRLVEVYDYLGRRDYFPEVRCYIKCPYYTGWAKLLRAPISFCCILIGNVPGARKLCEEESEGAEASEVVNAVQTRSARDKKIHTLVLPKVAPLDVTP